MTHGHEGVPAGTQPGPPVKRTRVSGAWVAVIVALVILSFLLVFIVQNLDTVTVRFLGMTGHMPLAVAMLLAALASMIMVALVGAARILQLRKATRKARKALR